MGFMFLRETKDASEDRDSASRVPPEVSLRYPCVQEVPWYKLTHVFLGLLGYVSGCRSPQFACLISTPHSRHAIN